MKKILLMVLFLFLSACSGRGGVMDTKITASNRDEIVQKAMPQMSDTERKLSFLIAYCLRLGSGDNLILKRN